MTLSLLDYFVQLPRDGGDSIAFDLGELNSQLWNSDSKLQVSLIRGGDAIVPSAPERPGRGIYDAAIVTQTVGAIPR